MIPARLRIAGGMLASVVVLSLSGSGRAQGSAGYALPLHAIGGGGGASTGAGFQLVGTIAQLEASGTATGSGFALEGGFWPGTIVAPTPMATGATPGTPTPSGFTTVTATVSGFVTPTPTTTPTRTPTPTVTATPVAPSTTPPTATATPNVEAASVRKCQAAIAKRSAAFVQAKLAALQQCQTKIVAGKLSGSCPDDDQETTEKIAAALQRMRDGIGKACGGKNKVCSVADTGADADALRTAIGFPAVCPGFAGHCSTTIADRDCGDIATCLGCIGGVAVDHAIALYSSVTPANPKTAKALNACQRTIGKSAVKLFTARSKVLQSCWGKVSSGKIPGPCPDAAKAEPAIAKATSQLEMAIAKACCGKNATCNLVDGGVDADFDPVMEIGFRTNCDSVAIPGGPSCEGTIGDMQSLRACLLCVTEFTTTCVSAAPFPAVARPYPTECE